MQTSAAPVGAGDLIAGKYVVDRVLGQGGMGVVVAATHTALNQRVAIKFLLPAACEHAGAVERFLREARAAVQIQSEHVARVIDVGTLETGSPYMVMEFLEGNDLADELEQRGKLPPTEACDYVLQSLEAIAEAHALHIVHRDLKPANLFLTRRKDGSRSIKVLDFGISKATNQGEASLTQTSSMMGSPLYMAPEQIRNAKGVDARADVWSLGIILYECLAGKVPFVSDTLPGVLASIVADPPEPLETRCPELPRELVEVVRRCLEKDPRQRVQSVAELAELLVPFAHQRAQISADRVFSILGHPVRGAVTQPQFAATSLATEAPAISAPQGATRTTQNWASTGTQSSVPTRPFPFVAVGLGVLGLAIVGVAGVAWSRADAEPAASAVAGEPSNAIPLDPPPTAPPSPAAAISANVAAPAASVVPAPSAEPAAPSTVPTVPPRSTARGSTRAASSTKAVASGAPVSPATTATPASKAPATSPAKAGDPLLGRR